MVIENNVPPLLSVGLLEHLGAQMDLVSNRVHFRKIGVDMKMTNLPTGHRAIPLVEWSGGKFPVPEAAKEQFSLEDDAFMKEGSASSAYTKGVRGAITRSSACRASQSRVVFVSDEPNYHKAQELHHRLPGPRDRTARLQELRPGARTTCESQCSAVVKPHVPDECGASVQHEIVSQGELQCMPPPHEGSIAPMGNVTAPGRPKFDFCARRRDHGTPSCSGGGIGHCECAGEQVETTRRADDVSLRGHSDPLLPAGRAREPRQEHPLGQAQLLGGGCSEAGLVLAPSSSHPEGESVRNMDCVLQVRCQADVRVEEKPHGEKQGSGPGRDVSCSPRRDSGCYGRDIPAYYEEHHDYRKIESRPHARDHPPRAQRNATGHGGVVPERGRDAEGADQRSKSDADIDAAERCPRPRPVDCSGSTGPGPRRPTGDASGRGGDRRVVAGDREPRGEPECRRPAVRYWPRWMTIPVISMSSSLISWTQMTSGMQQLVQRAGGDGDTWLLHHLPSGPSVKRASQAPSWTRLPWIAAIEGVAPSGQAVLWHELLDRAGEVRGHGPGDARGQGAERVLRWCCPRRLRLLHELRDPLSTIVGIDEHGESSEQGPYWLVRAPRLTRAMESEEIEAKVDDKEAKRAGDALIRLARQQQRAISGSQVDLAEVFRQTSATNAARAQGLVVPVEHEDFTFASGWDMTNKDHRRRLRHFLEHRRPQVVSMTWRIEDVPPGEPHEEVKFGLLASLALEVAKHQCSHGRSFFLRAPVPPGPWRELDWKQYLDVPGRQVRITQEHEYVVVTDLGDESSEAENEKICDETNEANVLMTDVPGSTVPDDGEKLAIKLMEESDYSPASCLRLLRETKWPRQRIKRASMKGSEAYQVLGQYSYGKFAGITLATYRLPHTLRYLNHFMTMRGALGPRSSLVVSRNASVNPHKDSNNIGQNYSIALGPFKGGELWEEDPGGQVMKEIKGAKVPGRLRKHHGKLNVFNPRKLHSVEPWTGERWSITAFQTRSAGKLSQEQEELLAKFGFQVRGYSQVIDLPSTRLSRQLVSYVESRCAGVPQDNFNFPVSTMDEIDPELDEENAEEPGHPEGNGSEEAEPRVSQHQKDLVRKLHVNTGHPPLERFLRTLKAAGALPHVLRYVRDEFRCETCNVKRGADPRRRAQCPRLFSFNRVLSIDVFFVSFRNRLEPILNVVCHGTNYQLAQRIESSSGAPTAHATWRALLTTWIRYLGPPSLIITDGGKEFQGRFERGLEQLGILQHVTAPESPWQNSRAERHGGWLKQKLTQELDSGQGIISSKEDLDELLASLVSAKNRWFNHGGYTPTQMVFGELPRVPGELLTSDETSLPVLNDAFHDPAGMDEAATEFKHRHQIRERARQLAMAETSREVLKRAARAAPHVNRSWATGQWVYVFRRGRVGDGLHPTSRWVPGIVVMPTPSIIWVAMRTRPLFPRATPSSVPDRGTGTSDRIGPPAWRVASEGRLWKSRWRG